MPYSTLRTCPNPLKQDCNARHHPGVQQQVEKKEMFHVVPGIAADRDSEREQAANTEQSKKFDRSPRFPPRTQPCGYADHRTYKQGDKDRLANGRETVLVESAPSIEGLALGPRREPR